MFKENPLRVALNHKSLLMHQVTTWKLTPQIISDLFIVVIFNILLRQNVEVITLMYHFYNITYYHRLLKSIGYYLHSTVNPALLASVGNKIPSYYRAFRVFLTDTSF